MAVFDMTIAKPPVLVDVSVVCDCVPSPIKGRKQPVSAWLHGAVRVGRSHRNSVKLVCSRCGKETFTWRSEILKQWVETFGPLPKQLKLPEAE
jgi:hypothetical protein